MQKSALITGASKRIGKEIAFALGKKGYHIFLHYHNSEELAQKTKTELEHENISCDMIRADLQNPPDIMHMMEWIFAQKTELSVIVNNASLFEMSTLENAEIENWDALMNVNLRAPWLIIKVAAEVLKRNNGCVVNILDAGIAKVWTQHAPYQISKVALAQLTKIMAATYAPHIRVNGIAPGLILPAENVSSLSWDKLLDRIPMKRQGSTSDIAEAVLFFIDQHYITGEILFVDGGSQLI
jgi:pteridine reductase